MTSHATAVRPDPSSASAPPRVRRLTPVWTTAFWLLPALLLAAAGDAAVASCQIKQPLSTVAATINPEGSY